MAYRPKRLRGLAIAQMVFGPIMIAFGVACIYCAYHWSSRVGFGVWFGSWVFIAGILGYIGARDDTTPNKCMVKWFLGFSIFACVIAGVMFICYCVTIFQYVELKDCQAEYSGPGQVHKFWFKDWGGDCYDRYGMKRDTAANVAVLGSCLLVFSFVEFYLALLASIYCCAVWYSGLQLQDMDYGRSTSSTFAVTSTATNQQVVFVQQPQYRSPWGRQQTLMPRRIEEQREMVIIHQPSVAVTTTTQGHQVAGQQATSQLPEGYGRPPPF
ncbi:hypothetical protein ACROYT_G030585 [Oculina patagonica]